MNMIRLNGKNKLIRSLSLITTLLYSLQLFAAPEDHGRWYSVDDDGSSSMSPIGFILGGIVLAFLSYTMLRVDNDKKSPISFYIFGLIGGIICIVVGFSRCSG